MRRLSRMLAAIAVTAALSGGTVGAQTYPTRTVTIIVPLAAGTGMDALVRLYGDKLSQVLGRAVVIENKPGAATMLAVAQMAAAAPDGHTLGVATSSAMSINPVLYKKINYNPDKDLTPVSFYVKSPFILLVNPNLGVTSVMDLIRVAKERKTPLTFSSPGAGVLQHLSIEYMKQRFNLNMTHVPYKSTPQSIQDIAAGHVDLGFAEAGASLPLIRDGKVRAIAVSSTTRLPTVPDVPPFAEAAKAPDFEAVSWHMLFAPSATPKDIIERLHREMATIMADAEMQKRAANIGLLPLTPPSIDETRKYLASESEKWGALVRKLGLAGTM